MSILSNRINLKSKILIAFSLIIFSALFFIAQNVFAQGGGIFNNDDGGTRDENDPQPQGLAYGDVFGWAWMGTGISDETVSQGGGGWISFNCKPTDCDNGNWGVQMSISHGLDPNLDGKFFGHAWSSNYGWLSFEEDDVESCWLNNDYVVPTMTAKAMIDGSGQGEVPVIGWAKFIAGDDEDDGAYDAWDGCVSFNGADYGVTLDQDTGLLSGWAWGGDVVGWLSFDADACEYCNISVLLPGTVFLNFWADPQTVSPGGSSTLYWEAVDDSPNFVAECTSYDNSSGYNHWGDAYNQPPIISSGVNLPNGSHPIGNIQESTTYTISCTDRDGNQLMEMSTIVSVINDPIVGCMDPSASNFNPNANVPDPDSCIYGGLPAVDLVLVTDNNPANTVPIGSSNTFDYQVSPRWTFTNPSQVGTPYCTGTFRDHNNVTRTLSGWTGAQLNRPAAPNWYPGPYSGINSVSSFATLPGIVPGSQFTYYINCVDINGDVFSDSATLTFQDQAPQPNLALDATPGSLVAGSGNYDVGLTWTSNLPNQLSACIGSLDAGNATNWDGSRSAPNVTTPFSVDLTPYASSASPGDTFVFNLTCIKSGGGNVSDTATVIVVEDTGGGGCPPNCPPTETPVVDLKIQSPNTDVNQLTDWEQLPTSGNSAVVVTWENEFIDTSSCVGSSVRYVGGTVPEPSTQWNSQNFTSLIGQATLDMSVPGSGGHPTEYTLTCTGNDGVTQASDTVYVLIEGVTCPDCEPNPGAGIPSYEEI